MTDASHHQIKFRFRQGRPFLNRVSFVRDRHKHLSVVVTDCSFAHCELFCFRTRWEEYLLSHSRTSNIGQTPDRSERDHVHGAVRLDSLVSLTAPRLGMSADACIFALHAKFQGNLRPESEQPLMRLGRRQVPKMCGHP